MTHSSTPTTRRRVLGVAVAAAAALGLGACVPEPAPGTTTPTSAPPSSTTPTTVPEPTIETITNGTLEWTISSEANNGTFSGDVNFWNASDVPATDEASYLATDGDVTVLKKNAAGNYVPIGSEESVSWANKNRDGAGNSVSATNAYYLDQKLSLTGGDGTVDTSTGEAVIEWDGAVTINFYGEMVPFSLTEITLTVDDSGDGTLTAVASGLAKEMGDPSAPGTPLPATQVVVAELPDVYESGSVSTGFTDAPTGYLGNAITLPAGVSQQAPLTGANEAYWGAWPQSFVDFQLDTGLASYWYTSGLASVDPKKPQAPISVAYNLD